MSLIIVLGNFMGLLGDFIRARWPAAVSSEIHDFLAWRASCENLMADLGAFLAGDLNEVTSPV